MIDILDSILLDFRLFDPHISRFGLPGLRHACSPKSSGSFFPPIASTTPCRRGGLIHTRTGNLILRERDATCGRRGVSAADEGFNKQRNSVPVVGQVADRTDQVLERRVRAVLIRVRHVF